MNFEEFNVSKETWAKIRRAGIETVADLLARIGEADVARAAALDRFDIQDINETLKRCDFEAILIPVPVLPLGPNGSMLLPADQIHTRLVNALAALARVSADLADAVEATEVAPPPISPPSTEGEKR